VGETKFYIKKRIFHFLQRAETAASAADFAITKASAPAPKAEPTTPKATPAAAPLVTDLTQEVVLLSVERS